MKNIFFLYLSWHFLDVPKNILVGWKNVLRFNLNYFSIPLLLRTLFSPWRRYHWTYPKGFQIGKIFEVFISNLISRVLGAVLRIFLIFVGVLMEILIILTGIIIFLGWLALPVLLIGGLGIGLKILF